MTEPGKDEPRRGAGLKTARPNDGTSAAGRWITRCQYYQIHPSERLPAQSVKRIAGGVQRVLQDLDLDAIVAQQALEARWAELVGRPLAGNSRPGQIENGTLTLFVKSPTWRFEMERHLGPALLEKLRGQLPEFRIQRLAIRIDPGRFIHPQDRA